jgi:hypothetical protein
MRNKNIFYIFILLLSARCSRLEDIMWKQADGSAFQVVISSPENNSSTNRAQVTFSGAAAVSNPFQIYRVELSVNGGVFSPATGGESWTADIVLPEGTNTIVARAVNTMGETNLSAPCRIIIDTIPPALVIDNPTNSQDTAPAYVFACTPADTMSGVADVFIRLDGGVFHPVTESAGGWTTNLSLTAYGTHTNYAYAADHAGNTSLTQTVVYSCTRPVLTVTAPTNDLYTYGIASYTLKGTCSAIGGISGIFLSTNNSPYFYISSQTEWSKAVSLVQGIYTTNQYKIYVMDSLGRISLTNSFKIVVYNKFVASDGAANDWFGYRGACISRNGTVIVIGSRGDDGGKGSAYVYRWNSTNWISTKLTASDGTGGTLFGSDVAIDADGTTVVAGAVNASGGKGAAYIYKLSSTNWMETKLIASDGASGDGFGWKTSISANGNRIAVCAWMDDGGKGSAYIYSWSGTNWAEKKIVAFDGLPEDRFGHSLCISGDGDTLVVGAYLDDVASYTDSGSIYVYKWDGTNWNETKITASDIAGGDYFGVGVSVSYDGNTLVSGAINDDIGAKADQGSIYIYHWNGSSWEETKLTAFDGAASDGLGYSLGISADSQTVFTTAFRDDSTRGSSYIFIWNGTGWYQNKFTAFDGVGGDAFGFSGALSLDGKTFTVGAWADNSFTGGAYIYRLE